jgi:hypothetical protein
MLRALAVRVILHGNIDGAIFALGHDHLPLLEYVISRYSREALLSGLPQHVVELGLGIQKVVSDGFPSELLLLLQLVVDVEVLEGVITKKTTLIFDLIEDLSDCRFALVIGRYRVQCDFLTLVLIFLQRGLRLTGCPLD